MANGYHVFPLVLVFNLSLTDDFLCINKDLRTYIHVYKRFPAKMTPAHERAILSIEKISYTRSRPRSRI